MISLSRRTLKGSNSVFCESFQGLYLCKGSTSDPNLYITFSFKLFHLLRYLLVSQIYVAFNKYLHDLKLNRLETYQHNSIRSDCMNVISNNHGERNPELSRSRSHFGNVSFVSLPQIVANGRKMYMRKIIRLQTKLI